jgi:chromosome segregation ATPase
VSAGAAATVLSGGTISPVGWVSVVRGCMTALKELDKLWSDVEGTGAAIRKELSLLDKWLVDKIDAETKAGKLEKGAREVGLNLLSKMLNVNVPSMKTCEEHIALHEKNITKLERKSKDVSEGIYAAMDAQEKWAKEFDKAKRDQPAPAVGKVKTELDKAEKSLDDILKKAVSLNERIAAAQKEHEAFEKAYTALEEGLPNWSKYVDSALSLAVDIGSGIQDASKAVEKGLAVVSALAQTAADEKLTARK